MSINFNVISTLLSRNEEQKFLVVIFASAVGAIQTTKLLITFFLDKNFTIFGSFKRSLFDSKIIKYLRRYFFEFCDAKSCLVPPSLGDSKVVSAL